MDPSYFRTLYQEAEAEALGLAFSDFRDALEQIGSGQFPALDYRKLHLKDLALALACRHGIESARERFSHRYRERLYSAAMAIARNDSMAHDLADSLCGELFVSRTGKLASYTGRGPLEGWLTAVLAQSYIDRYRSRRKAVSFDEQLGAMREACASEWLEEPHVDPRLNDAIKEAFMALPPQSRYLLTSYFFDRRTLAEIARKLTVHESTVSRRMDRLIRLLRTRIERLMREKGMTRRQVEESLQTDVRDLSLNIQSHLLRGVELARK